MPKRIIEPNTTLSSRSQTRFEPLSPEGDNKDTETRRIEKLRDSVSPWLAQNFFTKNKDFTCKRLSS